MPDHYLVVRGGGLFYFDLTIFLIAPAVMILTLLERI